ncbi:transglycosylase [Mycobacterium sp. 94-17]|uniref:transglycosylase SLT domain-containing protein n=1 Tax=Mycobacterium sp. 94-17 TaxID=2986147 RepID=UPI002D1EAD9F|nr:transglycosylase [Mycobacterium sp. 94-17]MEB4212351.1 transglycosylase [Mycobacterium sp. 94-17]
MTDSLKVRAVAALARAHDLFAGFSTADGIGDAAAQTRAHAGAMTRRTAGLPGPAAARSGASITRLTGSAHTDAGLGQIITAARADHTSTRAATRVVLDSALTDAAPAVDTPMGRREAAARMAARLRTQHRHVAASRRRARLLARRLRRLRYPRVRTMHSNQAGGRPAVLAAIRKALDIKGIHDPAARARWVRGMDLVAHRESNYNANAVNDWDSNAARGTPSKGAWQFIAPTFAAYHQLGTSRDIHNLVAQACAFINYAMGRYGVAADASNLADRIQQADPRRASKGY